MKMTTSTPIGSHTGITSTSIPMRDTLYRQDVLHSSVEQCHAPLMGQRGLGASGIVSNLSPLTITDPFDYYKDYQEKKQKKKQIQQSQQDANKKNTIVSPTAYANRLLSPNHSSCSSSSSDDMATSANTPCLSSSSSDGEDNYAVRIIIEDENIMWERVGLPASQTQGILPDSLSNDEEEEEEENESVGCLSRSMSDSDCSLKDLSSRSFSRSCSFEDCDKTMNRRETSEVVEDLEEDGDDADTTTESTQSLALPSHEIPRFYFPGQKNCVFNRTLRSIQSNSNTSSPLVSIKKELSSTSTCSSTNICNNKLITIPIQGGQQLLTMSIRDKQWIDMFFKPYLIASTTTAATPIPIIPTRSALLRRSNSGGSSSSRSSSSSSSGFVISPAKKLDSPNPSTATMECNTSNVRMPIEKFVSITKVVCQLPSYLNNLLAKRIQDYANRKLRAAAPGINGSSSLSLSSCTSSPSKVESNLSHNKLPVPAGNVASALVDCSSSSSSLPTSSSSFMAMNVKCESKREQMMLAAKKKPTKDCCEEDESASIHRDDMLGKVSPTSSSATSSASVSLDDLGRSFDEADTFEEGEEEEDDEQAESDREGENEEEEEEEERLNTSTSSELPDDSMMRSISTTSVDTAPSLPLKYSLPPASTASASSVATFVFYESFLLYWVDEIVPYDLTERLFRLLLPFNKETEKEKDNPVASLSPKDLLPLLQAIIAIHPSLKCLHEHPQYQFDYARTVIARIFFAGNTSRTGKMSLGEFRRSNLVEVLLSLDPLMTMTSATSLSSACPSAATATSIVASSVASASVGSINGMDTSMMKKILSPSLALQHSSASTVVDTKGLTDPITTTMHCVMKKMQSEEKVVCPVSPSSTIGGLTASAVAAAGASSSAATTGATEVTTTHDNIDNELYFFSYQDFYLLYTSFQQMISNRIHHNNNSSATTTTTTNLAILLKEDLIGYDENAMPLEIVDRLFVVGERALSDGLQGYASHRIPSPTTTTTGEGGEVVGMTYLDYVYFALNYVESNHISSLRFWFHLLNLDGENTLSIQVIKYWYDVMSRHYLAVANETRGIGSIVTILPVEYFLSQFMDALELRGSDNGSLTTMFTLNQLLDAKRDMRPFLDILINGHKFRQYQESKIV